MFTVQFEGWGARIWVKIEVTLINKLYFAPSILESNVIKVSKVWERQAQRYQTPIRVFTKKTKDDTMVTGRIENKHIINYSEKLKKTGQFLSLKYKAYT